MLSVSYFQYLLKSKKYLWIFVLLVSLFFNFALYDANTISRLIVNSVIALILCFIVPCILFSYVHNKKAIDTYYSTNISRKQLLITGLVFSIVLIFLNFAIGSIISFFFDKYPLLIVLPVSLLGISTLVVFNTFVYLVANNIFDGIVMLGAYTTLPFVIVFVLELFISAFIYGYTYRQLRFVYYSSPSYLFANTIYNLESFKTLSENIASFNISLIIEIIILVVFVFLLYKSFINRKVERAETASNAFLSYPFIINVYAFLSVFTIFTEYRLQTSARSFIGENIIFFLMIFAMYVIAYYVYKRKFFLDIKIVITYILIFFLSLGIVVVARNTHGFTLADRVVIKDNYAYEMYSWLSYPVEDEFLKGLGIDEKEAYKPDTYVGVYIRISGEISNKSGKMNEKSLAILEKYRTQAIDNYYSKKDTQEISSYDNYMIHIYEVIENTNLQTNYSTSFKYDGRKTWISVYNYNYVNGSISFEDLKALSYDKNISISVEYEDYDNYISYNYIDGVFHKMPN